MDHPFFEDGTIPVLHPLLTGHVPWALTISTTGLSPFSPHPPWSHPSSPKWLKYCKHGLISADWSGIITSRPAGHAYFNEVICLICDTSAVLVYVIWHPWKPQDPFGRPSISPFGFLPLQGPGVFLPWVHSFALGHVGLHDVCLLSPQIYNQVPLCWSSVFCHVRNF